MSRGCRIVGKPHLVVDGTSGDACTFGLGEPLYLERHRIRSGKQTITVTVPREPARAGVDRYGKLIQRDAADNRIDVDRRR